MKIKGLKKNGEVPEKIRKNGKEIETGKTVTIFKAPDGYKTTYKGFIREAERGRLHGCLIASS